MKRALILAALLLLGAPVAFVAAGRQVDSQKENIVVTESVLYGDPTAAEGLRLGTASWGEWERHLKWDTSYTIGSGHAGSSFAFSTLGEDGPRQKRDEITLYFVTNWGIVYDGANGAPIPYVPYFRRAVQAVADRTQPGERRTETVNIREYYEYYPLVFEIERSINNFVSFNMQFDAEDEVGLSEEGRALLNFFSIPVSDNETLEITLEKNIEGELVDLNCRNGVTGAKIINLSAFGQEGAYHAYYLEEWERTDDDVRISEEPAAPGENYGIFYYPYTHMEKSDSLTLDLVQIRKVCDLEPGIRLADMTLNETEDRLYLVTGEGQDIYLSIYQVDGAGLTLEQKIFVRSLAGEPGRETNSYLSQLSVREEGVLMVWEDGSFAFAVCKDEEFKLWCLEQDPVLGLLFSEENVWDFHGEEERLALAAFGEEGNSVNLAVYAEDGLAYLGLCKYSGDMIYEIRGVEWK